MYARTHVQELHKLTVKTIRKMKKKQLLAVLLLMVAGMQTAWGQGFRVYQSDGTQLQFSLSTDSIVFDNGLSGDEVFGPFTPVNQCVTKTWYKSRTETVTFNADGTTDFMEGAFYEFMPYQGNIIINNASGVPMNILRVYKVTDEMLVVGALGSSSFSVWYSTKPAQLVTSITLSETNITLQPNEIKSLTASIEPSDADNPAVMWTSSNEAVAEVSSTGMVTANAIGTCTITCSATDGSGVKAECVVTVKEHEYVDLGLPSGTLWATCNVGASSPEEYGDYFAWGETEPKDTYNWSTYKWCNGSYNTITKYCTGSNYGKVDNKTELKPVDDAATANWGSGWQMPSLVQLQELYNYTTATWTTQNGVNGRKMTSITNGNSIFLPAAGYRNDTNLNSAGSNGNYWSRSLYTNYSNNAYGLDFNSGSLNWNYNNRSFGRSVRPVRVQE